MITKLINLFRIPGPVELGMSKYDALPCRDFTPFGNDGPTWEDYYERISNEYPIRYYIVHVLLKSIHQKIYNLKQDFYRFKHRYIYRSHLIDVSKVCPNENPFDYGYMDPSYTFWIAGWQALRRYVEECNPIDPESLYSEEEKNNDYYKRAKESHDEVIALYMYWMVERPEEEAACTRLFEYRNMAAKGTNEEAYNIASNAWLDYHDAIEKREEEMFLRLAKIRPYLWS